MKVIVTGGAGFIGSNLVRLLLERGHEVLNIDALTYAGNVRSLDGTADSPAYRFLHADVRDAALMRNTLREYGPDWVMHLAAESHVDRSIDDPGDFMTTNVMGTFSMLQAALEYYRSLEGEKKERFRFHHISTDEVYGSLGKDGLFTESTPYRPHSPYSASKASSDHLVRAWHDTYGLPVLITNCSNNYGPYQFPEKLIPVVVLKALGGEPIPVYGKGITVPWRGRRRSVSASTIFPRTKYTAPWGRTACLRNPRRTAPIPPIPPARRPATIWCAPGMIRTGCPC